MLFQMCFYLLIRNHVFPHHAWLRAYLIEPEQNPHQEEHAETDNK